MSEMVTAEPTKSVSEQMVEEDDKEFYGEAEKAAQSEQYNPPLSLAALRTPAHDAKLDELGPAILVRCQVRVVQGNRVETFPYTVITEKPEELVFETGPVVTTELVSTKPLTPAERRTLEQLLAD